MSVIGNGDTALDAGEWFNLGTVADDASIQAAINGSQHSIGAIFAVFNTSTGKAEAWYDVTDGLTTGDANKVAYLEGYSETMINAFSSGTAMGIELVDYATAINGVPAP